MAAKSFGVSSFTSVGHLLHINLRDHLLPNKHEIGNALLQKIPRALAVVNKVDSIDNTFRNFEMEIIAKREDCTLTDEEIMVVDVNENRCRFRFDFSKVYWNSRLSTEHERIIAKLNRHIDIVFDLFAGVGPFAVPAAKYQCKTYANDLNPESVVWLKFNMKHNKVHPDNFEITNIDAKDYINKMLRTKLIDEYMKIDDEQLATLPKIHIIMNLPALAPKFLTNFVGLFKDCDYKMNSSQLSDMFNRQNLDHRVYCYCFLKGAFEDPCSQVKMMIEENFGRSIDEELVDIFKVRNVATYKDMYRVEIKLSPAILFGLKSPVSIMKSLNGKQNLNGTNKKVTIQAPSGKRSREDSVDSSGDATDDEDRKRSKSATTSSYCSIM